MEASKKRYIRPGNEFNHLFAVANNRDKTIRRNANLDDTVVFIPKVVKETLHQTQAIARNLKGKDLYDTCKRIWHFVYENINYKKDRDGYEQIRSPARTWHDRHYGVDCDCYSVFISSILTNLGIPHILRITKYHRSYFQHIYPVVLHGSRTITIDCVTDWFDYEVPFTEKKDYPMELQYLDGFDGASLGFLGKKKKKVIPAKSKPATPSSSASSVITASKKKKGVLKKVLNVVNKVNPATVLLRNGVLAAMKLNIKNVAQRLRWSYLPPDKIGKHGIDPAKYQKLVATRQKLENIFYGAGGKPENLRKAILSGKGNKDKAVSGLGMVPTSQWNGYLNEYSPIGELLGNDIYYSENIEGMQGFQGLGQLGEPVTLASVGAAMGVIAGIVAALKQIGSIFKKGSPGDADFNEAATDAPENNVNEAAAKAAVTAAVASGAVIQPATSTAPASDSTAASNNAGSSSTNSIVPSASNPTPVTPGVANEVIEEKEETTYTTSTSSGDTNTNTDPDKKEGFWEKNKKWLKPVAIGTGGLILIAIGVSLVKGNKAKTSSSSSNHSLSGIPKKRKKKRPKSHKQKRKQAVALL